jgi:hypothetical protein
MTTGTFKSIPLAAPVFQPFCIKVPEVGRRSRKSNTPTSPQWSQRFSIVPTGRVSGVIPRASMTYLVYAYGFDWFVHA